MASAVLGLNANKHREHVHDTVGAAKRLGLSAYVDPSEGWVYVDAPDGTSEDWRDEETVILTLPDGTVWNCWIEVRDDETE